MKTVVLSDHTGDMVARGERRHNQRHEIEMERYRRESEELVGRIEEEYQGRVAAYERELVEWNSMSWLRKFADGVSRMRVLFVLCVVAMGVCVLTYLLMPAEWMVLLAVPVMAGYMALFFSTRAPRRPVHDRVSMRLVEPVPPPREEATDEEERWLAGNEGEHRVVDHLSGLLGDEWTLVSGYRGPGGEVDQILVGPRGVCALETKYLNGTVYVSGDSWKLDKYDSYGNRVESGRPIEDRKGRSPSEQLNGAVRPLERFLARRGLVKRISRAVVLTHDRSRVGRVERKTVDRIETLSELHVDGLFSRRSQRLERDWVEKVVGFIGRDHEFHSKRSKHPGRRRR